MKNRELYRLRDGLLSCRNLSGAKFVYAVVKNLKAVNDEIADLEEVAKPRAEYIAYDRERIRLNQEHAEKDNTGNPVIDQKTQNFVIEKKLQKAFDAKVETLKKKHRNALEAREKQVADFNKLLEAKSTFKPHMIEEESLPENITVEQLNAIIDIIV